MYKKTRNSGFTLVELMVVMAIIAILATAGITQYSSFIGKARDTARLADIKAIETAIISYQSSNNSTPTKAQILGVITSGTGRTFKDAKTGATGCLKADGTTSTSCGYVYTQCDGTGGYKLSVTFENKDNVGLYTKDGLSTTVAPATSGINNTDTYNIGSCNAITGTETCTIGGTTTTTPAGC